MKDLELFKQFSDGQNKYAFYLLSVAAACIALTLKRTDNMKLDYTMIVLGLAVASWSISFICGCYERKHTYNIMRANFDQIKAEKAYYASNSPRETRLNAKSVIDATNIAMDELAVKEKNMAKIQWRCLIFGAAMYIVWHTIQMYNYVPKK